MAMFSGLRLAGLYSLGRSRMFHEINDLEEAIGKNEMWCKERRQWSQRLERELNDCLRAQVWRKSF
jgi:hypothetical protein